MIAREQPPVLPKLRDGDPRFLVAACNEVRRPDKLHDHFELNLALDKMDQG